MSIKQAIIEKNQGNDVEKSEYTNLIMDDMQINQISDEDKTFLEDFQECQFLSFNSTSMKSIDNLPALPKLERLELNDNSLEGGFDVIARCYPELKVLKMSNNKIKVLDSVKHLSALTKLESLDLSNNPICQVPKPDVTPAEAVQPVGEGAEPEQIKEQPPVTTAESVVTNYTTTIRTMLPTLNLLDGFNKDGQEIISDEDETYEESENAEDDFVEEDMEDEEMGEDEQDEVDGVDATKATADVGESETGDKVVGEPDLEKVQKVDKVVEEPVVEKSANEAV